MIACPVTKRVFPDGESCIFRGDKPIGAVAPPSDCVTAESFPEPASIENTEISNDPEFPTYKKVPPESADGFLQSIGKAIRSDRYRSADLWMIWDMVRSMRAAGIRYAFSYYGGFRRFDDWVDYDVRRVPIEPEVTRDWFRCLVTIPEVFAR